MNLTKIFLSLSIAILFIQCSSDNSIHHTLEEPKIEFTFGILQGYWAYQDIKEDTIYFNNLDSTIVLEISHVNITHPNDIALLTHSQSDDKKWIHTIPIKTNKDKEVFVTDKNVFVMSYSGYGMSKINGIETYDTEFSMLIPVKIGVEAVAGNDTLELDNTDLDYIDVTYSSPILDIDGDAKLYIKKF
ncbi:hypothetical protein SAMN05421640_3717 [Ekhidna lutea]|uniref:Uncharacterized protein n=1 Tax=Ekhidna lutea TaxID=447679 RepID=A0A239M9Z1_EKHLU|nr:hypothetical protein [Ekhidna lutea]SNT38903.1 hypothetical protein SAMN05421640_3717 [Ekhidna lutea]